MDIIRILKLFCFVLNCQIMNTEIKFKFVIDEKHLTRAFTLEEILEGYEELVIESLDKCNCVLTESSPTCEGDCLQFENSKITGTIQFTGLKDKNGVDIYDGYIIKTNHRIYDGGVCLNKVLFKKGSFVLECKNKTDAVLSMYTSKQMEIVGNIYQNTELLK